MNTTLCEAITNLKIIELRYSGFSRMVEPYAYGRNKKGEEILRCYQISGGSKSGEGEGWKILKVRDVYSLHLTQNMFKARPNYKKGDKAIDHMFCEI